MDKKLEKIRARLPYIDKDELYWMLSEIERLRPIEATARQTSNRLTELHNTLEKRWREQSSEAMLTDLSVEEAAVLEELRIMVGWLESALTEGSE